MLLLQVIHQDRVLPPQEQLFLKEIWTQSANFILLQRLFQVVMNQSCINMILETQQ